MSRSRTPRGPPRRVYPCVTARGLARETRSPHVSGHSVAKAPADLVVCRSNADLLRLIAQRALRLEAARKAAGASSIAADDFAAGDLTIARSSFVDRWQLKSVFFDCASGRAPRATVFCRDGSAFQLNPDDGFDWRELSEPSALPLNMDEAACECGFVNKRPAASVSQASCVSCAAPVVKNEEVAA